MRQALVYVANRLWLIAVIYIASIFCAAALFAVFEGRSFGDGIWWAGVTALTIGYGDLSPVTIQGRVTGMMFGHFWIFGIIPMIVANIITRTLKDDDKFTHREQEWQERALKAIAQKLQITLDEAPPDIDD